MVSESFRQQLSAAFEKLLHEHEQKVVHFADAIAALCENEVCDGRGIAKALRDLPGSRDYERKQTRQQSRGSKLSALSETLNAPNEALVGSRDVGGYKTPPSTFNLGSGTVSLSQSMSPRGAKIMKKMQNKPKVGAGVNTLTGCETEDVTRMQSQFRVDRLRFLTKEGKIVKPPSHWAEHLGPIGSYVKALAHRLTSFIELLGEPEPSIWLKIVESQWFKVFSILAITLNYFFIIVSTDWKMNHLNKDDPAIFRVIDLFFTSYYALELIVSIIALRGQFFFGFDCGWNWFDMVIVFFSIFQEFLQLWDIQSIDTSFLRVLRFLRISKILRMFEAMRMFKEVKIMVDSIQGSFVVFAMCCLLLALYLSIFAIFFVQGIQVKLEEEGIESHLHEMMVKHFGSCSDAMVTLFQALTGGRDWDEYYRVVQGMGWVYSTLFLFFFLFALMSIFNVVTGVFCEKAMSLARPGPLEQMIRRQQKDMRDASELIALLKKVLKIKEPFPPITSDNFDFFINNDEVITYFEARDMHVSSAHRFFEVLTDISQAETIDVATLVSACVRLDGPASNIDLHILDIEMKAIQIGLYHTHCQLTDQIDKLGSRLERLLKDGVGHESRQSSRMSEIDHLRHISNTKGLPSVPLREPQTPITPMFDSQHLVINHDFSNSHYPGWGVRQDATELFAGGDNFSPPSVQFADRTFPEANAGGNVFTFHYV